MKISNKEGQQNFFNVYSTAIYYVFVLSPQCTNSNNLEYLFHSPWSFQMVLVKKKKRTIDGGFAWTTGV